MKKKPHSKPDECCKPQYILFNGREFRVFAVDLKEHDNSSPRNIEYEWSILTQHFTIVVTMAANEDYGRETFKHHTPTAVYDAENDFGANGTAHFSKVRPRFLKDGKLESDSHSFFEHVDQVVKRQHKPEEAKIVAAVLQAEKASTRHVHHPPQKNGSHIFKPMGNDWKEVILDGMKIDLRDRERAKEFLRYLWENGAKRRSNAIPVAGKFPKPSSLFSPGEKFVSRGRGNTEKDVPVKSELGTRIHRVYQDAVGLVKPKKGTGPHKYFLRAFPDSDKT